MALTEESFADKIEVTGDFSHVQVRVATVIKRDGEEISRSFSRHVVTPVTATLMKTLKFRRCVPQFTPKT